MRRFKDNQPELVEPICRNGRLATRPGADKAYEAAMRGAYPDDRNVVLNAEKYFEGMGRIDRAEACLRQVLERRSLKDQPAARQLFHRALGPARETWRGGLGPAGPEGPREQQRRKIVWHAASC